MMNNENDKYLKLPQNDGSWIMFIIITVVVFVWSLFSAPWENGLLTGLATALSSAIVIGMLCLGFLFISSIFKIFWPPLYFNGITYKTRLNGKELIFNKSEIKHIVLINGSRPPRAKIILKNKTEFKILVPLFLSEAILLENNKDAIYKALSKWYKKKMEKHKRKI